MVIRCHEYLMALFHWVVRLGSTRLSMAQHGSVRISTLNFKFSTALEWAGLFKCRYSCAASTAVTPEKLFNSASLHQALAGSTPRLSKRGTSVLPQQTTKKGALVQNSCVRSAGCADLNLAGLLCLVHGLVSQVQWRFSPANQWSAEFTHHVLVTVRLAWNLNRGGTEKSTRYCTQWKPPQKWTIPNRTVPYHAVEKRHKTYCCCTNSI